MFDNIKADLLGLEHEVFKSAIVKLDNEGCISGVNIISGGGVVQAVHLKNMMITRYGIDYVENKIGIEKTLSGGEKIKELAKKVAEVGWDKGSDLIAKVLSELIMPS